MAKAGIFRYYPTGQDNQNAAGNSPVVDVNGNPDLGNSFGDRLVRFLQLPGRACPELQNLQ